MPNTQQHAGHGQARPGLCHRCAKVPAPEVYEGAEDSRQANGNGVRQRKADIANRDIERRASDAEGRPHQEAVNIGTLAILPALGQDADRA